jgi:hypothetical protein
MGVKILFVLALPLAAQFVEENRVVTKRFPVSGAPEIVVSIITGDIKVTATSGSEVVMNAKVHYEAPDGGSLGDLLKRIRLETEQQGNNVWIGTEADEWNNGSSWSGRRREFGMAEQYAAAAGIVVRRGWTALALPARYRAASASDGASQAEHRQWRRDRRYGRGRPVQFQQRQRGYRC